MVDFQRRVVIPEKVFPWKELPRMKGSIDLGFGALGRVYEMPTTPPERVYSVTTLLGNTMTPEKRFILYKWIESKGEKEAERIKIRAGIRGNHIHDTSEYLLRNQPDYLRAVGPYRKLFEQFRSLLNNITEVHACEIPLFSRVAKVAGRVDCVGRYKGIMSIIDFKTSIKMKNQSMIEDYKLQCTLYSLMIEEMYGIVYDQCVVIIAVEESTIPQEFIFSRADYIKPLAERIKQFRRMLNDSNSPNNILRPPE